ncbi:hypothetical protein QR680_011603 [Steinernema hermaphroditum]|uniref:Uncharacterized protein n=1 Tax=Steinernema hermaphroditum TaxID=289476 RepID=A0AA39I1I4_9BILA|nr:hypothetical protein QR680_011603 [Steinernema hermaphroditum]
MKHMLMFSKYQTSEKAESSPKKKLFQNENEDEDLRQLASDNDKENDLRPHPESINLGQGKIDEDITHVLKIFNEEGFKRII